MTSEQMTNGQMPCIVLSCFQVEDVLKARAAGSDSVVVSLDLGLTDAEVTMEPEGVRFPDGQALAWKDLEMIGASEHSCFVVEDNVPRKIRVFSEATKQLYSLMPTEGAPTMLISGIR